ncbi:MAG TPA: DUF6279 family lipoprotein [Burkholderiaceae bacterium]|nr:DUF6279 family lipoprotein [Burkholderiaceae bacterium]
MQNFIMRLYRAWAPQAVLLLVMFSLAGCSLTRFGYNHGEMLSYWWLNSYANISSDQRPWVKQRITRLFAWHRSTQLRDYAHLLALAQNHLQHNTGKNELLADFDEMRKRAAVALDKALPDLADLALSLKPAQIAQIERKFAANNEAYRKDYMRGSLEQRQLFRFKKVLEQAEYWFGAFSYEQTVLIRRASDARPLNHELLLRDRQYRQRQMIAMLRKIQAERPSREATMQMLKGYAQTMFEHAGGGEHEQVFNASKDATAAMVVAIINCTTPTQKAHAAKRLQQWIDSFNALAAQRS